jgi:hypothetical protein
MPLDGRKPSSQRVQRRGSGRPISDAHSIEKSRLRQPLIFFQTTTCAKRPFRRISREREASKIPSKTRSKQGTAEDSHSTKRNGATRASYGRPKYLTCGKLSYGSKSGILFSVPSDGTICWSTNVVYDTPAAVSVPSVGSSLGHVGVSSNVNATISSQLGAPQGLVFDRLRVSVHD